MPPPGGYARPQAPPPQYQQPQPQYPPPGQPAQGYAPPVQPPGAAAPGLPPPAKPRKNRASLRFLASSCIFSGWLTLVVSILFSIGSVVAGLGAQRSASAAATSTQYFPTSEPAAPPAPSPLRNAGDPDGVGFNEADESDAILNGMKRPGLNVGNNLGALVPLLMNPTTFFLSAVVTLLTGVVTCLLFLGFGQVCYMLLDLEEQTAQTAQALQLISARLNR